MLRSVFKVIHRHNLTSRQYAILLVACQWIPEPDDWCAVVFETIFLLEGHALI